MVDHVPVPGRRHLGERALVVVRHHLHELRQQLVPLVEDARGDGRAGALCVLLDERADDRDVGLLERVEADELLVAAAVEAAVLVEDVGDAAAHAGGEVAAGAAEDDDVTAGHVLAAVVADALDDRRHARVADREALAGEPAEERLPGRRAVEDRVADDHVLLGREGRRLRRPDGDRAAGQSLACVVVRVAEERQLDAGREPRAERLARPSRAA